MQAILKILILILAVQGFAADWSTHPALQRFDLEEGSLPSALFLVRTRGQLPAVQGVTVHGEDNGLFLVSGSEEDVLGLVPMGCGVYPLENLAVQHQPEPRTWAYRTEPDPIVQEMVNQVNWPAIQETINWLVGFETRFSTAPNRDAVVSGIQNRFTDMGLSTELHPFDYNGTTLHNVIATQTGTVYPDSFFIICGHFDSVSGDPYNSAPGADDNGTGTATVITAADILSDYAFEYSIKYICFSGEEQGLKGSAAYAQWASSSGLGIVGVMNFDMLGYWEPGVEADLEVEANNASVWLSSAILNAADLYTETVYELHIDDGAWWGDHASFWANGFYAVNHEEAWDWGDPDFNPYYHTIYDLPEYIGEDFMVANTELCIAALATLAEPDITGTAAASHHPVDPNSVTFSLRSNPTGSPTFIIEGLYGFDTAQIEVFDLSGRLLHGVETSLSNGAGICVWEGSSHSGTYLARITAGDYSSSKQFVIAE